ncbi:AraC family transcriptional regulator [uncultured Pontibacter sp.]|uniref:helix-turn-helix domain-containing protein n=1 Tax=uncultured Pontibacter sp. TaxID=453356 RepID=UPI0026321DBB|nr:AraC family transcriptional regulator [uncultured Pontibacter sp.]
MEKGYQIISVNNILYSCGSKAQRNGEQFIDVHVLGFVLTGELHLTTPEKVIIMKAGSMGLIKRNQLVKATKVPPPGGEFSSINIFLTQDILRKYISEIPQDITGKTHGESFFEIQKDALLKAYFQSLQPYFQAPERFTPQLAELKTREAFELILNIEPELKEVLFDFSEPHKIDLEAFMHQNYMFNVSIDGLAKLTGRSRAGFKRDFEKIFRTSPGQWIKQKRLEQAYYLIKEKGIKPSNAYLDVGFENLSHFSYAFKQAFGINPSSLLHA